MTPDNPDLSSQALFDGLAGLDELAELSFDEVCLTPDDRAALCAAHPALEIVNGEPIACYSLAAGARPTTPGLVSFLAW